MGQKDFGKSDWPTHGSSSESMKKRPTPETPTSGKPKSEVPKPKGQVIKPGGDGSIYK